MCWVGGAGGIGQVSFGGRLDWSRVSAGVGGISETCHRRGQDWPQFLWNITGLVRILLLKFRTGQNSNWSVQDWTRLRHTGSSSFRRITLVPDQKSFGTGQNWSEFICQFGIG